MRHPAALSPPAAQATPLRDDIEMMKVKHGDLPLWMATSWWPSPMTDLPAPETSSTSCDQVVFVDQATDMSPSPDTVLVEVDRFGVAVSAARRPRQ